MTRLCNLLAIASLALSSVCFAQGQQVQCSKTSTFNGTAQNPLTGHDQWTHDASWWAVMEQENGVAKGTQDGSGSYNDSYALRTGSDVPHTDTEFQCVVIDITGEPTAATHEILIGWWDDDNLPNVLGNGHVWGVNTLFSYTGNYVDLGRWDNPQNGEFVSIDSASIDPLEDGDLLCMGKNGDTYTVYINSEEILSDSDDIYEQLYPGIGAFISGGDASDNDTMTIDSYTLTVFGAVCP